MRIVLETLPLTTNRLYGFANGRRYLRPEGRDNKDAMAWEARSQYRGDPFQGPLVVDVQLFYPTRRNHDIENLKGLFDAMSGVLYEDDGQICDLRIRKGYDKERPRVEMSVEAISAKTVPNPPKGRGASL